MENLQVIEIRGQRVLTTKQIAEAYGTAPERIKLNYRYNKARFAIGKHLISIEDDELREFKARYQFDTQFKYAKSLYLWTEKGALLHAKSLNTDKAWEVYDYLVDFYFRRKESIEIKREMQIIKSEPLKRTVVDIPDNKMAQKMISEAKRSMMAMDVLIDQCNKYLSPEKYENYKAVIAELTLYVSGCLSSFSLIKPQLIEKQY